MAEFRERLKSEMKRQGLSQAELCLRTGIPKSALSQYLSGCFKPREGRIRIMADALGVDPAWLIGFDVYDGENDENQGYLTDRETILLSLYRSNSRFRKKIDELIDDSSSNIFRAAKSSGGDISPSREVMAKEQLEKIMTAPETDEDF